MTPTPTFETRAELTAWMERTLMGANQLRGEDQLALIQSIRPVVMAHMHLPYDDTPTPRRDGAGL